MKNLKMRRVAQILTVALIVALTVSLGVLCAQAADCTHEEGFENGFCIGCGGAQEAPLKDGVYEISNAGQLYYVAQQMRTKGSTLLQAKLTCNVTVNTQLLMSNGQPRTGAKLWTPVGSGTTPATNIVLDGQGHYISGLYAKYEDGRDVGLFGYTLDGVVVKNLGIVDSYFYSDNGFVGGIIANAKGETQISYCYVDATLESPVDQAGGIAGALDSAVGATPSEAKYCYTTYSKVVKGAAGGSVLEACYYRADSETDAFDGTECFDADFKLADESTLLEALCKGNKTWVKSCYTGKPALLADHVYAYVCTPECTVCGDTNRVDQAAHTYDNECDRSCNVCTRINPEPVVHLALYPCGTVCRYCGATFPAAKGHQYSTACDDTCDCGYVREQVPHVYDFPCDSVCKQCHDVRVGADHAYDNACDSTCNYNCGTTRQAMHVYDAVCDETCKVCGGKRNAAVAHIYGDFTVTKAAGTLRNGEQTRTCSVCGHVDVQVIPRTGMQTWVVVLIGVGAGLALSVGGFALYWFVFKKRSLAEFLGKK